MLEPDMTDAQLVRRMQGGDRDALEVFYGRYLPAVWRFAQARLARDESAVRDVVSETFLAAIGGIGDLNLARGSACGWLMGIARHKVADWWRKNPEMVAMPELAGAESLDPACQMEHAESLTAVGLVMTEMDDDERLVLEWKYLEGLSVREIARRMGRTEKGVEALLYRARTEFRARYPAGQEARRRSST
jgi:RNA polymerase sigma-70 factor, ECF subfamily